MAHTLQKKNPFWFYFAINILVVLNGIGDIVNAIVQMSVSHYDSTLHSCIAVIIIWSLTVVFSLTWLGLNFKFKSKYPIPFFVWTLAQFLSYIASGVSNIIFSDDAVSFSIINTIIWILMVGTPFVFVVLCIKLEKIWTRILSIVFLSISATVCFFGCIALAIIEITEEFNYSTFIPFINGFMMVSLLLFVDITIGITYRFKKVRPAAQPQPQYVQQPVAQQPIAYVPVYANQVIYAAQQQVAPQQTENQQ